MALIGRLFVRGVMVAGAIGAAAAIALAPQPGVANNIGLDDHSTTGTVVRTSEPAPSAACVAAKTAFFAALKADVAEDASERDLTKTGTNTTDATEDQTEHANFASLRKAMVTACDPDDAAQPQHQTPTPTAACTAAKAALKSFFTQRMADEKADWTNGTEGTAADKAEDAAAWAQAKTLFQAAATACGFTKTFDRR
jgi:hypothetical protein